MEKRGLVEGGARSRLGLRELGGVAGELRSEARALKSLVVGWSCFTAKKNLLWGSDVTIKMFCYKRRDESIVCKQDQKSVNRKAVVRDSSPHARRNVRHYDLVQ